MSYRVIFLLTALAFMLGCKSQHDEDIRVGICPWPAYEFLYLAQEKNIYTQLGVSVKLIEFSSLSDARRAYERGQIDALATTAVEAIEVREHSTRLPQIVYAIDYSSGADVIIAQPEIKTVSDLKRKKIGVELASLGGYILRRALELNGLALSDIQLISTSQLEMKEALSNKSLDAIVTYPPVSVLISNTQKYNQIFSSRDIPREVIDVIAVDSELIKHRAKEVQKILKAFRQAQEYTVNNPQEAYHIMAEREGLAVEQFKSSLNNGITLISYLHQHEYLSPGGVLDQALIRIAKTLRIVKNNGSSKEMLLNGIVNNSFITTEDSN